MAVSVHAYVRGSTKRFYAWLESAGHVELSEGPPVWICGDCYIGNLGPVASSDGKLAVQIRDLDQTVIGHPAHDLVRLALSLAMLARSADLPGVTTALMLESMMEGYSRAFFSLEDANADLQTVDLPKTIRVVVRQAHAILEKPSGSRHNWHAAFTADWQALSATDFCRKRCGERPA